MAKITDVKNNLSKYLENVKKGEVVIIYERKFPIAEIIPITKSNHSVNHYIDELERDGIIKKGSGKKIKELTLQSVNGKEHGVLAALLQERQNGK